MVQGEDGGEGGGGGGVEGEDKFERASELIRASAREELVFKR